jgi:hypothetical protein
MFFLMKYDFDSICCDYCLINRATQQLMDSVKADGAAPAALTNFAQSFSSLLQGRIGDSAGLSFKFGDSLIGLPRLPDASVTSPYVFLLQMGLGAFRSVVGPGAPLEEDVEEFDWNSIV